MNRYISKELIVFVFPFLVSLFTVSTVSFYQNSKLSKQTMKTLLDFDKNLKEKSEKLLQFEEFTLEALERSVNRVRREEKIFFTFGLRQKIYEDSLKQTPAEITNLKFELIKDLGKLEQYVKLKDELSYTNYENFWSLLNSEKVFILNLEEYLQFILTNSKLSDEIFFRKCESSYFDIHGKVITLDRFEDIKEDVDKKLSNAKEIHDVYWVEFRELHILKMLSILGILVSSTFMFFLIRASIKNNLFKENISQMCRD